MKLGEHFIQDRIINNYDMALKNVEMSGKWKIQNFHEPRYHSDVKRKWIFLEMF